MKIGGVIVRIAGVGGYFANIKRKKQVSMRREAWGDEKGWDTSVDFKVYNRYS